MKLLRKVGVTSEIWQIFIRDSSSTTGAGLTGLTNASSGLVAYYHRDTDTTATAISLVTMTVGTFTSSGFKEIDSTNMPGWYQFCPPNAALASGAKSCAFHLNGATSMVPLPIECQLISADIDDAVRLGLTAIPNIAIGSANCLARSSDGSASTITSGVGDARLADGVSHGGTLGSSTATLALSLTSTGAFLINGVSDVAQTGDSYARLGVPAGASIAADLAEIEAETDGIAAIPTSNPTATAIATAVWQDTTAGDFTVASSIGKSLYTSGAVPGASNGLLIAGSNAATTFASGSHFVGTVDTVTTNTDMRGTDNAALAATALSTAQWTNARAGYLDNLNVGGAVASHADIAAINQSASKHLLLQTVGQYERPESGTTVYTVEMRTFAAADGAAVNADTTPTLTATGQTSGSLSGNLSAASNPATGVYRWTYTVSSGDTQEPIRFDGSATISSATFTLSCYSQVVDEVSATWTSADIAAVKSDSAAIKAKTDSLTFTVPNVLDANVVDWKGTTAPANTGDAFARLGAPAGVSIAADLAEIEAETDGIAAIPTTPLLAANVPSNFSSLLISAGGVVSADAVKIDGSTTAATLQKQAASVIYQGSVTGAATTTTLVDSGLTQADVDFWKGRVLIFLTGSLKYQAAAITAFDPVTDQLTFDAMTNVPSGADTYVIV